MGMPEAFRIFEFTMALMTSENQSQNLLFFTIQIFQKLTKCHDEK